ncbi:SDR family NAD(P)-dependent oxidoreductase [Halomonas litopenaei]|uniref:SDR family NAD(P)-dependent oxidoreductase n=1 Tax=Halomonas litopenaei TaxID=2109328 RepID=UPI003F9FD83C
MDRLPDGYHALIIGGNGGIGRAVVDRLLADPRLGQVTVVSRTPFEASSSRLEAIEGDVTTPQGRAELGRALHGPGGLAVHLHLVVNAIGLLHDDANNIQPEKRLEDLDEAALATLFQVNAATPALMIQTLLPHLKGSHPTTVVSLSARVGSIGDNGLGGWYAYRASKAAHNMLMKTAAIELKRLNPQSCVLSFHPGTTDSSLSRPFQARVPANKLFTADFVAEQLMSMVQQRGPADSGGFFDWANEAIPW